MFTRSFKLNATVGKVKAFYFLSMFLAQKNGRALNYNEKIG